MSSLNKVILIGRLGKDPEVRYTADGNAIANVSIATSETWKDKGTGEKKESTEWHRVVFFNRLGEIVGEYLKKGSLVYVEGRIRTNKWTDKQNIERYTTEIVASEMKILSSRNASGGDRGHSEDGMPDYQAPETSSPARSGGGATGNNTSKAAPMDDFHDDVPF